MAVRLVKDREAVVSPFPLDSPIKIVSAMSEMMSRFDREVVGIINFKSDMTPINVHFASVGALNEAMAHPREIFKAAILSNAANMIMIHNHPSGNLSPSEPDIMMTDRMIMAGEIMGIPVLDHIIVGGEGNEYFSFREKKKQSIPKITLKNDYNALSFSKVCEETSEKAQENKKRPSLTKHLKEKKEQVPLKVRKPVSCHEEQR